MVFLRDVTNSSLDIFSRPEKSKELVAGLVARPEEVGVRGSGVDGIDDGWGALSCNKTPIMIEGEEST